MSSSTSQAEAQGQLVAQNTTQVLARIFTGHVVGQPAMGYSPLEGVVVVAHGPTTDRRVTVTLNGFTAPAGQPPPTFTAKYQNPATVTPPTPGTPVLVSFPGNEPQNVGWAIDFLGWPKTATPGAIVKTTPGPP